MDFFRKKIVAIPLSFILVVLATLFSVNRSLGALCREVEDGFYSGVVYDGQKRPSIQSHLNTRLERSATIVSIAASHEDLEEQTDAIRDARDWLLFTLEDGYIRGSFAANEALQEAVTALTLTLENAVLSERETQLLETCLSDFTEAFRAISECGYNETVREFIRTTYDRFPTNLLAMLSGVRAPEYFSA